MELAEINAQLRIDKYSGRGSVDTGPLPEDKVQLALLYVPLGNTTCSPPTTPRHPPPLGWHAVDDPEPQTGGSDALYGEGPANLTLTLTLIRWFVRTGRSCQPRDGCPS